jgi:hypothetical protein
MDAGGAMKIMKVMKEMKTILQFVKNEISLWLSVFVLA